MKTALVFIEVKDNQIKKSSLECLTALAGSGWTLHTCGFKETHSCVDELKRWGVQKHFTTDNSDLDKFNPETHLQFVDKALQESGAQLFLASSNSHGRDIFPRLAVRHDAAYMSDVTEIKIEDNVSIARPLYAGKCTARVVFTDDSKKIILLRPNQVMVINPNGSGACEVISLSPQEGAGKNKTISIQDGESEKLDLTEANIIVSGGRGLKEAKNFKLLEDLAAPLNATVGASRAVVDLGWVPHSQQVGQTGKTVAPTLYIAAGISGAIQHLAGMSGSKNIVAINKDDKAPIFQKATYGIVGDLFEVIPVLTEKLQSLK